MTQEDKIFSISEYLSFLNEGFKHFKAKIMGEVSEVSFGPTGHCFFNLKDKKDGSIIKCVIYKSRYDIHGIEVKEGIELVSLGCPNMHSTYGFGFIAESIQYYGEGKLKEQYDKLKKKLEKEGFFLKERKRPIPNYPQRIGIITSEQGSVLADFLNNLGRFGFNIKMINSRVDGAVAISDLLISIKKFKKQNIDVLVIARGGGSLESMIAFNNEQLVKEIAEFPVPVIAAIGHDKDVPFVSLTADVEVSTPTKAAIVLNKSWEDALRLIERRENIIINYFNNDLIKVKDIIYESKRKIKSGSDYIIGKYRDIEMKLSLFNHKIATSIKSVKKRIDDSVSDILSGFEAIMDIANNDLKNNTKTITHNNPERQLRLGYSIVRLDDKIIKSIGNIKKGDNINVSVSDGLISSEVKGLSKNK